MNEFCFEHPKEIITRINMTSDILSQYTNCFELNREIVEELSKMNCVDTDELVLTAGSDHGLELLFNMHLQSSSCVCVFVPVYPYALDIISRNTNNIQKVQLSINNTDEINDFDIRTCMVVFDKVDCVYIANPNNPLGTMFHISTIEKCLKQHTNTVFIIDEAYIEYSTSQSCAKLINCYDNIFITRTFSKAYGLAGPRLGYVMTCSVNASKIRDLINPKSITTFSKRCGLFVLQNIGYYNECIQQVRDNRQEFEAYLIEHNIYYFKSQGNFVSLYVGAKHSQLVQLFNDHGILVRDCEIHGLCGFIRISIGSREMMKHVRFVISSNLDIFQECVYQVYMPIQTYWSLRLMFKHLMGVINTSTIKDKIWLDAGSLLGYYRHNGIIPWDDDIDLMMHDTDTHYLQSLEPELNSFGLRLKRNRTDCYYQIDFISEIDPNQSHITNPVHIDIFQIDEHYVQTDPRFRDYKYDRETVYPLVKTQFLNVTVNIPFDVEKLIKQHYGTGCVEQAYIRKTNQTLNIKNILVNWV